MNCQEVQEIFDELEDGDLPQADVRRANAHLARCPDCRRLYDAHRREHARWLALLNDPTNRVPPFPAGLADRVVAACRPVPAAPRPFFRFHFPRFALRLAATFVLLLGVAAALAATVAVFTAKRPGGTTAAASTNSVTAAGTASAVSTSADVSASLSSSSSLDASADLNDTTETGAAETAVSGIHEDETMNSITQTLAAAVSSAMLVTASATAADLTWKGGDGNWTDSGVWLDSSGTATNWVAGSKAIFPAASGAVTVACGSTAISVSGMDFQGGDYIVSGITTLTLGTGGLSSTNGSAAVTASHVSFGGNTTIGAGVTLTAPASNLGTGSTTASVEPNKITVNGTWNHDDLLIGESIRRAVTVTGTGTLRTKDLYTRGNGSGVTLSGGLRANFIGGVLLHREWGYFAMSDVTIGAYGSDLTCNTHKDKGKVTLTGTVTFDTLDAADGTTARTIAADVNGCTYNGTGNLRKVNPGKLAFTYAAAYTGDTVVDGGVIQYANTCSSASMTVTNAAAEARFTGSVTFAGTVNLANGGILSTTNSAANTLTLSGAVTLNDGAVLAFDVLSATCDKLAFTGSLAVSSNATVKAVLDAPAAVAGITYQLTSGANLSSLDGWAVEAVGTDQVPELSLTGGDIYVTFTAPASTLSTWTGLGGDANWSTLANWDPSAVAPTNRTLTFAGSVRTTTTNDYEVGATFTSIIFGESAAAFTLSGNALTLTSGAIANLSTNPQRVALPVTVEGGALGIAAGAGGVTLADAAFTATSFAKSGAGPLTFENTSCNFGLNVGAGETVNMAGTNAFTGALSFDTNTVISGGVSSFGAIGTLGTYKNLTLTNGADLTSSITWYSNNKNSSITIAPDSVLRLTSVYGSYGFILIADGELDITPSLSLASNAEIDGAGVCNFLDGTVSAKGTLYMNAARVNSATNGLAQSMSLVANTTFAPIDGDFAVSASVGTISGGTGVGFCSTDVSGAPRTVTVSGAVSGDADVTISGTGTVVYAGTKSYTGSTTVSNGTLRLLTDLASTSVVVKAGATLSLSNDAVAAAALNALSLESGATLILDVGAACADTVIPGAFAADTNTTFLLNLLEGAGPGTYTLVTTNAPASTNGLVLAFVNAGAAGYLKASAGELQAVITTSPYANAADVWTGNSATSSLWSDAANWKSGLVPDGTRPVFFTGTRRLVNTNDLVVTFPTLSFATSAGAFRLCGEALTVAGAITNLSIYAQTFALPIGGSTFALVEGGNGPFVLDGVTGADVTSLTLDAGTLALAGASSFTKATLSVGDSAGYFVLADGAAAASLAVGTFQPYSATIGPGVAIAAASAGDAMRYARTFTLNGSFTTPAAFFTGGHTLSGTIYSDVYEVAGTGTLQVAGINIGTSGILTLDGIRLVNTGASFTTRQWGTINFNGTTVALGGTDSTEPGTAEVNGINLTGETTFDTLDALDGVTPRTLTFKSKVGGTGRMVKTGAGTLVFANAAAYTGSTSIGAGLVHYASTFSSSWLGISDGGAATFDLAQTLGINIGVYSAGSLTNLAGISARSLTLHDSNTVARLGGACAFTNLEISAGATLSLATTATTLSADTNTLASGAIVRLAADKDGSCSKLSSSGDVYLPGLKIVLDFPSASPLSGVWDVWTANSFSGYSAIDFSLDSQTGNWKALVIDNADGTQTLRIQHTIGFYLRIQ